MSSGAGHSGGGFRGGRYRSRGRPIPYSRGGGDSANWKRSSNGGGFGVKTESDQNRPKADVASPSTEGGTVEKQSLLTTPDQERGSVQSSPSVMQPGLDTSSGAGELADLREVKRKEMKSSVKARLFVGNLPKDTSQDIVRELFRQFGEVKEMFLQREKNFGFVKMVYRSDAECAVASLDGKNFKGRDLKVRFAASNSSVKVSNLHPVVSNELLLEAFSQFGEVEKAVVVTDERGKSLGHGIVDFSRKGYAQNAIRKCIDEHFILTKSPMPVLVEEYLRDNDEDGQPERYVPKSASYRIEREVPPRFALPHSVEHAVATQWKLAYESEKRQRDELEQRLRQARGSLVNEMDSIREQHQTELLRQELAHHQQEQLRLVQQLRMRQPTSAMLEPSTVTSLFPTPPSDRTLEDAPALENPSYGGMNAGAPPVGGSGFAAGGSTMPPPPLMGQVL